MLYYKFRWIIDSFDSRLEPISDQLNESAYRFTIKIVRHSEISHSLDQPFAPLPKLVVTVSALINEKLRTMKLFAVLLLLAIVASCINAQHVTSWGDVKNTKILAEQKTEVGGSILKVTERTVSYQSVNMN